MIASDFRKMAAVYEWIARFLRSGSCWAVMAACPLIHSRTAIGSEDGRSSITEPTAEAFSLISHYQASQLFYFDKCRV